MNRALTFLCLGLSFATAPADADDSLARGRYMVVTGHCNNCHTAGYQQSAGKTPEKDWLTGRDVGHRGPWGTTYPANLRNNVNKMSEAEWVAYASKLKTRPGMPWWSVRDTTPDDLRAMYRFIKSLGPSDIPSRPALPPGEEPKTLVIRVVVPPKPPGPPPTAPAIKPNPLSDSVRERGRYMLVTGHCNNCHTANYGPAEGNVPESEWLKGSPAGHRGAWGTTYATNLRVHVAAMSEAQWVDYAKTLKSRPPMPWWSLHETQEDDLRAMYRFIKSLGPAGEPAPAPLPPDREPAPPYTQWPAIFGD